jgi:conjugal transfer ATP-binding protein TraC
MLFLGRRGQLCNWNPFDNDTGNFNCVVVGRSGTGKSVFMQDLLLNGLATGARVFVLEVGRSFEKMCHLVGGQSIEFSKGSGLCLNPFTLISESCPDERNQSFSMLRSIVCEMCAPTSGTNDLQNALVEQGIQAAWAKRGRQATITDIGEWLFAQSDERATSLGTMLSPFMSGGNYATYFEGENNINFSSAMVLVELEELKNQKDLQSVALQIFMMNISSQVFLGDRTTPFYICVDEAWDLLRGKQTGIFIETLARRLRKYRGSLVIGTQNIDDFFASEGARAAYENSDWMCVLGQKKSSIQRLNESNKMTLDEHQMALIGSVTTRQGEYSEVAILDPEGGCSVLRLVLDPFSELLYSTKAEEFARINELKSSGASTFEAIEEVVAERRRG